MRREANTTITKRLDQIKNPSTYKTGYDLGAWRFGMNKTMETLDLEFK